ncbi:branched-chain amino acid ABC transporter ATP-binding protein/permease [Conexibacter stalactiti]|uniref:Branched-chain amino acid ABC transporter ATP-binding protein/permease n=1 Tax=Conexibacter stalactiti TaxID=1940611 RepID=A0ABU4HIA7_9ACTN|nr:branched-chain amino acid ABC transporter ATP-binding protein/permease [Conexibacter stalactiti]MDW5593042.1 branched-chain amino acid ABC transporter ATP-binding protein/permease [Conexibacter stalactiti]MEC5033683.1 branched-chain amino acid ABC transporter ATP-binding protein/permease [Conexibacter stalactiti]
MTSSIVTSFAFLGETDISYINLALIYAIYAVSLNLLLGYAGQVTLAPAAFGAIGGYSVARLFLDGNGLEVGLLVGFSVALVFGVLIGIIALRLTLIWLVVLTLAFSTIVPQVIIVLRKPDLGQVGGLTNIVDVPFFGHVLRDPSDLLPVTLAFAAIVFLVCLRMGESPYGRVLRAVRDDTTAIQTLGKNTFRYKLQVFGLTSGMAGIAGGLIVVQSTVAAPGTFSFDASLAIFAIVVIGGMGNLYGSLLGAALITAATPFFQNVLGIDPLKATLWQLIAYGAALIIVIRLRPQGLLPAGSRYTRDLIARVRGTRPAPEPPDRGPAMQAPSVRPPAMPASRNGGQSARPVLDGEIAVRARGLEKSFGGVRAVQGVDIDLKRGAVTALVGPNGAGKTTVFNLIAGALRPDAGSVVLDDVEIAGKRPDEIAALGMVRSFQDVRLFPQMTARDNVAVAVPGQPGESLARLFAAPAAVGRGERAALEMADEWLEFVGMSGAATTPAAALSYGEQKLVSLARVLATDAQVILLDEPASGIEGSWVQAMLDLIDRVRDQGRTVCIVEHNMHVIEQIADVTYFMESGRVVASGDVGELLKDNHLAEVYFGTV